jgi:hypothetical protein
VNTGVGRQTGQGLIVAPASFHLLGLMHGHYKVDVKKLDAEELKDEAINMGIAIVLPAERIFDILNGPELTAIREQADQRAQQEHLPTMDAAEVVTYPTADLMGKLLQVPKDEADEVHRSHDQP